MNVYTRRCRRVAVALVVVLATVFIGCGDGDDDSTVVTAGDNVVLTLSWSPPDSLDLSLILPSSRIVAFDDLSEGGCTLVPMPTPPGTPANIRTPPAPTATPGPAQDTITCPAIGPGTYKAFLNSNEPQPVPAMLEISANGTVIDVFSDDVPGQGQSGPYKIEAE